MPKVQTNGSGSVYTVNGSVLLDNTNEPVINSLNITPSTSSQLITAPTGVDGYNNINVSAVTSSVDQNISAENIKKDISILGVTGTYEGSGGGSSGKYQFLQRIIDDSNDEIGTVCGFYKDSNSVEYAVICLDATYRLAQGQWAASSGTITNMPLYGTWDSNVNGTETATQNCTLILASKASTAVSHCRSKSFSINGTTYYGQLPNVCELLMILGTHTILYNMDPTVLSVATDLNFVQNGFPSPAWSSSQYSANYGWSITDDGNMYVERKTTGYFVCPILEIPNTL